MDIIAAFYDLHCFESDTEHLEFIDYLVGDNRYLCPVVERGQGGVPSPNPTQRVSKAANEWLASHLLPGGSNPGVSLHQILSSGK